MCLPCSPCTRPKDSSFRWCSSSVWMRACCRTSAPSKTRKSWRKSGACSMSVLPGPRIGCFSGRHSRDPRFGEGIVTSARLDGDDEEVTITFASEGVKRLAASLARLDVLEDDDCPEGIAMLLFEPIRAKSFT